MAGRRIYSQLLFAISFSSSLTFFNLALVLINIFCNFTQQRLRADDFQIPPHRQAVSVVQKTGFARLLDNMDLTKFEKKFFASLKSFSKLRQVLRRWLQGYKTNVTTK